MNTPLRIRRIALLGMAGVMAGSLVGTSLVAHAQEAEPPTVTVEDDIQNALGLGAEAEGHASPLPRRILTLWRIIPHFKPFDRLCTINVFYSPFVVQIGFYSHECLEFPSSSLPLRFIWSGLELSDFPFR